jgi:hypothetical protein
MNTNNLQIKLLFPDAVKQSTWCGLSSKNVVSTTPNVMCPDAIKYLNDSAADWRAARRWKIAKIIVLSGMIGMGMNLLFKPISHPNYPYLKRVLMAAVIIPSTIGVDELFTIMEHDRRSTAKGKHKEAVDSSIAAFKDLKATFDTDKIKEGTHYELQKEAIRKAFWAYGINYKEADKILHELDSSIEIHPDVVDPS